MAGFTRSDITARAGELVNNTSLSSVSKDFLNIILHRIYTGYTWKFLLTTATISYSAGATSAAVPNDYGKHFHLKWVDTTVSPNQEQSLEYIEPKEYVLIADPTRQEERPRVYTVFPGYGLSSVSEGDITIFPTFDSANTLLLYYYKIPGHLTAGSDVPIFPDHKFLIDALANELFKYLRDPRHDPNFIEVNMNVVRNNIEDTGAFQTKDFNLNPYVFRPHPRGGRTW